MVGFLVIQIHQKNYPENFSLLTVKAGGGVKGQKCKLGLSDREFYTDSCGF